MDKMSKMTISQAGGGGSHPSVTKVERGDGELRATGQSVENKIKMLGGGSKKVLFET